jgi:O-6-methylguanine DNA methyltransferase
MKLKFETGIFYQIFSAPVGKIYIISTEKHLTDVIFGMGILDYNLRDYKDKSTAEIEKALDFFGSYFAKHKITNLNRIAAAINFDFTSYTPNEVKVYKNLLKISFGKIFSYKELAEKSGFPRGSRFIGNCMAKNRFPVIIPCHRVIKSDGSIGNYSGGPGIKEKLLEHEGVLK